MKLVNACVTAASRRGAEADFLRLQLDRLRERSNALRGYYAVQLGNSVPTFRTNLSVPSSRDFLTPEDGTYTLSRNIGKGLSLDTA